MCCGWNTTQVRMTIIITSPVLPSSVPVLTDKWFLVLENSQFLFVFPAATVVVGAVSVSPLLFPHPGSNNSLSKWARHTCRGWIYVALMFIAAILGEFLFCVHKFHCEKTKSNSNNRLSRSSNRIILGLVFSIWGKVYQLTFKLHLRLDLSGHKWGSLSPKRHDNNQEWWRLGEQEDSVTKVNQQTDNKNASCAGERGEILLLRNRTPTFPPLLYHHWQHVTEPLIFK